MTTIVGALLKNLRAQADLHGHIEAKVFKSLLSFVKKLFSLRLQTQVQMKPVPPSSTDIPDFLEEKKKKTPQVDVDKDLSVKAGLRILQELMGFASKVWLV